MSREKPIPDWMKIPTQLQQQFFDHAEEEAKKCKERLMEREKKLSALRKLIKIEPIPHSDEWKDWRVAVVDGSNSPWTSERLGGRYGAYCAGYMIFDGTKPVKETYYSDSFSQDQLGSHDVAQKLLSMLRYKMEREVALHCLNEEDVDWVLVDGSFFGFRAEAHVINEEIIDLKGFHRGLDLTADIRDKTLGLLESGKVVGVIKRTRTNALDGWLVHEYGDESHCTNCNDKHALTSLMPKGSWFAYEWLFDPPEAFHYFARYRGTYRYLMKERRGKLDSQKFYEATKRYVSNHIKRSLDYGYFERILRTARYYVRCSKTPPFEFEVKIGTRVEPLLAYFLSFHNPATGLPWPIDLIDENVSLPRGFLREFVNEVEAQLIRDPDLQDKLSLAGHFSYLNPQKEED